MHADGAFIVWLSRLKPGGPVPERTATTDLLPRAAARAAARGLSFYLLGATEAVNAAAAAALVRRHPGLSIVRRRHGYFAPGSAEEASVLAEIARLRPDVLWLGLGKPREQVWAHRHRDRLACAWVVTAGGCFNFVAGDYARAPLWMQRAGLEWVHRMATGPRHLVGRYLLTVPHALGLVLGHDLLAPLWPRQRGRERG